MSNNSIKNYFDGVSAFPEEIIRSVLKKHNCDLFKLTGFEGTYPKEKGVIDPDTNLNLHFKMPNGHWANISGKLFDNRHHDRNLRLDYCIDNCEEYADYEIVGTYYDTLEETVEAILKDMIGLSSGMEEKGELLSGDNVSKRTGYKAPNIDLEESQQAGVELYKDDGKLKAKFLGTKVVSGKTHNKLSDLQTTGDVKELTPSQKQSVKGIIGNLSSKGKLGDINKDFNTDPDIVFKSNGDAVIYPDNGKPSYRLNAKEIEKFEEAKRARKKFSESIDVDESNFIPLQGGSTGVAPEDLKAGKKVLDELANLLSGPMTEMGCTIHREHGTVYVTDDYAGNGIIDVQIGFESRGRWAVQVEYIGLDPADIYDIAVTPIEEIVNIIIDTATPPESGEEDSEYWEDPDGLQYYESTQKKKRSFKLNEENAWHFMKKFGIEEREAENAAVTYNAWHNQCINYNITPYIMKEVIPVIRNSELTSINDIVQAYIVENQVRDIDILFKMIITEIEGGLDFLETNPKLTFSNSPLDAEYCVSCMEKILRKIRENI